MVDEGQAGPETPANPGDSSPTLNSAADSGTEDRALAIVLLAQLEQDAPEAYELARLVCMAVQVEPALLRQIRLSLRPDFSALSELQLWQSEIVHTATRDYFTFLSAVALELRARAGTLPLKDLESSWELVQRQHGWLEGIHDGPPFVSGQGPEPLLPPLLLQEYLQWLDIRRRLEPMRADTFARAQAEALERLTTSIWQGDLTAARWVYFALSSLDPRVQWLPAARRAQQATRARLPELRGRSFLSALPSPAREITPGDTAGVALPRGIPTEPVRVTREGNELVVTRGETFPGSISLELPRTWPLMVYVGWEAEGREKRVQLDLPETGALRWPMPAGVTTFTLHNGWGEGVVVGVETVSASPLSIAELLATVRRQVTVLGGFLSQEDAEDITQRIMLILLGLEGSSRLISQQSKYELLKMTRAMVLRVLLQMPRKNWREISIDADIQLAAVSEPIDDLIGVRQTLAAVQDAVGSLSPQAQLIFEAYFIDGREAREIASTLGVSLDSVHQNLSRIRKYLRDGDRRSANGNPKKQGPEVGHNAQIASLDKQKYAPFVPSAWRKWAKAEYDRFPPMLTALGSVRFRLEHAYVELYLMWHSPQDLRTADELQRSWEQRQSSPADRSPADATPPRSASGKPVPGAKRYGRVSIEAPMRADSLLVSWGNQSR